MYFMRRNNVCNCKFIVCVVAIKCGIPPAGVGVSRREYSGIMYSDTVQYLCPVGHRDEFTLLQAVRGNCTDTGYWHPTQVICKREWHTTEKLWTVSTKNSTSQT